MKYSIYICRGVGKGRWMRYGVVIIVEGGGGYEEK
jgi:hypothetical protein